MLDDGTDSSILCARLQVRQKGNIPSPECDEHCQHAVQLLRVAKADAADGLIPQLNNVVDPEFNPLRQVFEGATTGPALHPRAVAGQVGLGGTFWKGLFCREQGPCWRTSAIMGAQHLQDACKTCETFVSALLRE